MCTSNYQVPTMSSNLEQIINLLVGYLIDCDLFYEIDIYFYFIKYFLQ